MKLHMPKSKFYIILNYGILKIDTGFYNHMMNLIIVNIIMFRLNLKITNLLTLRLL
jgi:hypothetical protein